MREVKLTKLREAFKQYLISNHGLSDDDATLFASDYPNVYDNCYLEVEFYEKKDDGIYSIETEEVSTNFSGFMTMNQETEPFRCFISYILDTTDEDHETVGYQKTCEKKYYLPEEGDEVE